MLILKLNEVFGHSCKVGDTCFSLDSDDMMVVVVTSMPASVTTDQQTNTHKTPCAGLVVTSNADLRCVPSREPLMFLGFAIQTKTFLCFQNNCLLM